MASGSVMKGGSSSSEMKRNVKRSLKSREAFFDDFLRWILCVTPISFLGHIRKERKRREKSKTRVPKQQREREKTACGMRRKNPFLFKFQTQILSKRRNSRDRLRERERERCVRELEEDVEEKSNECSKTDEQSTKEKMKSPLHVSVMSPLSTPLAEYHPSSPRSRALYGTSFAHSTKANT